MPALCKPFQTVGISRWCGILSGTTPPKKKKEKKRKEKKRNLGKINFRQFISGQSGAEWLVGCLLVPWSRPRCEFWHPEVTSSGWSQESTSLLHLLHLLNENDNYSHIPGLFWRRNEMLCGKDLANCSVLRKMFVPFSLSRTELRKVHVFGHLSMSENK